MSLDCVRVHRDNLVEGIEGNISGIKESQSEMARNCVEIYRILLSRLLRNFPRILIAITRKPVSASISKMVKTVSYKIEFPTFFVESVLVATYEEKREP